MNKSFYDLLEETKNMTIQEARDYFSSFFSEGNEDLYDIDADADENGKKAILKLFENDKIYKDKINDALSFNEYCKEAILLERRGYEDPIVEAEFSCVYLDYQKYDTLSDYEKICFHSFLDIYSDFLLDVGNVTKSIKVLKKLMELSDDYSKENMRKIAFRYSMIENKDDFYEFYLEHQFRYPEPYLLLISTLLKHEEFDKAKEVLNEMVEEIKYGDYIYHMWELDDDSVEANEFKEAVDLCFDDIITYPNFFSFCRDNIDANVLKS